MVGCGGGVGDGGWSKMRGEGGGRGRRREGKARARVPTGARISSPHPLKRSQEPGNESWPSPPCQGCSPPWVIQPCASCSFSASCGTLSGMSGNVLPSWWRGGGMRKEKRAARHSQVPVRMSRGYEVLCCHGWLLSRLFSSPASVSHPSPPPPSFSQRRPICTSN